MQKSECLDWLTSPPVESEKAVIDIAPEHAKYTIVTDWFSAILTGGLLVQYDCPQDEYIYDAGNIVFKRLPYSAKMFNFGYEVLFRGKPFGKVHVSPKKNGVLKKNNVQLEIENNIQYEIGWLDDVKYFLNAMTWRVQNVSRVDIALDGKYFFDVFNKYLSGKIDRKGMAEEQIFRKRINGKPTLTGFDIGKRSSDKWVTCYNKTRELQTSNKDYIKKYWERAGLDTSHVERMELKLRNDALKEINFDWQRIDDFEYLASIFRTFIEGGYVDWVNRKTGEVIRKRKSGIINFIEVNDDKNVSRKRRIRFINWKYIGAKPLERYSSEKSNEVWAMKLTCKRLVWLSIATEQKAKTLEKWFEDAEEKEIYRNRSRMFMNQAHEVAKNINCLQWLIDKYDDWVSEYSRKKLDFLPSYQVADINQQLKLIDIVPVHRAF